MIEKPSKKTNKRFLFCLLLTAYCLLLPASCGRRGDPVLIEPHKEKAVESSRQEGPQDSEKQEASTDLRTNEQGTVQVTTPDAPSGLIGIYTRTSIVVTWNEITGNNIKYRIYRSTGNGYLPLGETVTPAFTDREVEPNKKYYYKVSAVGLNEGPLSKEIQIITEVH
jgi:fibronectin type 3 domain-containing protein